LTSLDLLLGAGADPNRQGHVTSLTDRNNADHPTGGFTALMFAARAGNDALVRRLLERGANINLKNGDGASAAMVAMYNDWFDVAATLIERGSDVNDGSLYVAVEMRDATTDQFAFDGSRRRPDHPNKATALDPASSEQTPIEPAVQGRSIPRTCQHRPVRQHRFPRRRRRRRRSAQGDGRARRQLDQMPPNQRGSLAISRLGSPRQSEHRRTPAMVAVTGGRGPAMTGGAAYIRDGAAPYREPGSRKPEAVALLLAAGANPNAKSPMARRCCTRLRAGAPRDHSRGHGQVVQSEERQRLRRSTSPKANSQPGAGPRDGGPPGGGRGAGGRVSGMWPSCCAGLMGLPPAPPSTTAEGARRERGDLRSALFLLRRFASGRRRRPSLPDRLRRQRRGPVLAGMSPSGANRWSRNAIGCYNTRNPLPPARRSHSTRPASRIPVPTPQPGSASSKLGVGAMPPQIGAPGPAGSGGRSASSPASTRRPRRRAVPARTCCTA
jgi:hypothetical protein